MVGFVFKDSDKKAYPHTPALLLTPKWPGAAYTETYTDNSVTEALHSALASCSAPWTQTAPLQLLTIHDHQLQLLLSVVA